MAKTKINIELFDRDALELIDLLRALEVSEKVLPKVRAKAKKYKTKIMIALAQQSTP